MWTSGASVLFFLVVCCVSATTSRDAVDEWTTEKSNSIPGFLASKRWTRAVENPMFAEATPAHQSLCSDRATARGSNQSVVSFSFLREDLFDERLFILGIAINARKLLTMYPTWVMRLYHKINKDDFIWSTLNALEKRFSHLDLCNVSSLSFLRNKQDMLPLTWRFLPLGDSLVKQFVSRDLDTIALPREKAAIDEWLASSLAFHVMRDHGTQKASIPGGLWGAKRYIAPKIMDKLYNDILYESRSIVSVDTDNLKRISWDLLKDCVWGSSKRTSQDTVLETIRTAINKHKNDEDVLRHVLWKEMKGKVMQHSSFHCDLFRDQGNMLPFPTKREGKLYVGFQMTNATNLPAVPCPKACRPKEHQDWTYC